MCGSPDFLVHHAGLVCPPKHRVEFRRALKFLLTNQFVQSKLHPHRIWQCMEGTGMGLKSNSDVANAAFLHAVEVTGLSLLSGASRSRFGIKWYCRYFDNLLFILEPDFNRISALKRSLEKNLKPYTAVLEEASHISVSFLDIQICKHDIRSRITCECAYHPIL